jgi:biotin/methionine sulfoxide reductase
LQLIANQPATRLHSQLDFGANSQNSKIEGREPVRIHPRDATARGIGDGDIVRLYNDRGACLAAAVLSDALRPGVAQLSTGCASSRSRDSTVRCHRSRHSTLHPVRRDR